jgi:hypothetical protein
MAGDLRKVVDERHFPSEANGGGLLRWEVWVDDENRVARYNLAYINPFLYGPDNGRVLGYDSAHGRPHRHFKGDISDVDYRSFEEIEERFKSEWRELIGKARNATGRNQD